MINGVSSNTYVSRIVYSNQERTATLNTDRSATGESGVILDIGNQETKSDVYEKPPGKINTEELNRILEESRKATESLQDLVKTLIEKQGKTVEGVLNGTESVDLDTETKTEAAKMISDNGDWGISAVSSRIVNFAKALAGGDPSKFKELKKAIEKGFEQAREALGGVLPDICQKTYDETMKKLNEWGSTENTGSAENTDHTIKA